MLSNVTEEDSGEYTCQVSNYIGQVSQSGWLTVLPGKNENETSIPQHPLCWCFGLFFLSSWWSWDFRWAVVVWFGVFLIFWWIFPGAQSAMETSLWSVIATAFLFCSVSSFPPTFSPLIYRFSLVLSWQKIAACFPCFFTCVCMNPWGCGGFTCVGYRGFGLHLYLRLWRFYPALPFWRSSSLPKWNIYHLCNA